MIEFGTTVQEGFYYLDGTFFIDAGCADAKELMEKYPNVPAVNGAALKLVRDLMRADVDAQAKLELLKKAITCL
jgi:hypothetical protein